MAGEPTMTVVGNLTADPELRFTPSGAAVANFTVAQTPRVKRGDDFEDGQTTFWRCSVWRQHGENVAESLRRGDRVIVHGRVSTREYETRDGERRLSLEIDAEHVGAELRFATAKVQRGSRGGSSAPRGRNRGSSNDYGYGQDDPWGSAPPPSQGYMDDEPPF